MNTTKILSLISGLVLMSACGSSVTHDGLASSASAVSTGTQTSSTSNVENLPLAPEYTAKITGANGAIPNVVYSLTTSKTLRIKVTPLTAPNLSLNGYNNWVFPYGCMSLSVTANGTTQTTQVLRVAGATQGSTSKCANQPTSQVLDFSNAVTGGSAINLTISNGNYDNCRYTWPLNYGCDMSAIFTTHEIAATIAAQIDGTWLNP